jgi:uncharacterized protein (DUF1684 family)
MTVAPRGSSAGLEPAIEDWNRWHAERLRRLSAEDGWLTLIDLAFLDDGAWPMGRGSANRLRYDHATAERVGCFLAESDRVTFACDLDAGGHAAAEVTADGRLIDTIELVGDHRGKPTLLRNGPLTITLVRRNDRLALRVRDNASPTRTAFAGIDRFPYDPSVVLEAQVEPAAAGTSLAITNVSGFVSNEPLAATLHLVVRGQPVRLAATRGYDGQLFVVFGDATNRSSTYGGGRFLDLQAPAGSSDAAVARGTVLVDFNRAYNPPCSFTPYATCPTPPAANRLPVAIEAGERHPAPDPPRP